MTELLQITNGNKTIEVSEKAYRVVYQEHGYKVVGEEVTQDLFLLTADQLKKVTKEKIIAFLEQEEIEHNPRDNKDVLISLITGEEGDLDDNGGSQEDTSDKDDNS